MKKIFLIVSTLLCISCAGSKGPTKNDAAAYMNDYFEKVKLQDFTLVESYYSDDFYKTTSKEEWKEMYNKIHADLGPLISAELESWGIRSVVGTSGSGKYFTFVYQCRYENGGTSETIVLFAPSGSKEMKINSHNINSSILDQNDIDREPGPRNIIAGNNLIYQLRLI